MTTSERAWRDSAAAVWRNNIEAPSTAGCAELAAQQRGIRVAAALGEISVLGHEFHCEGGPAVYRILAGSRGPRVLTVDPHRATAHLTRMSGVQLRALAQKERQDDVNLTIAREIRAVAEADVHVAWRAEVLSPRRGPDMQGRQVSPVLAHTITFHVSGAVSKPTSKDPLSLRGRKRRQQTPYWRRWSEVPCRRPWRR